MGRLLRPTRSITPRPYRLTLLLVLMLVGVARAGDPFLWLERLHSPRASRWVARQNDETVSVLGSTPVYHDVFHQLATILNSPARLPWPVMAGGYVYNFWRDADHNRGLWRRTTPRGYRRSDPPWTTLLDLDRLSRREKRPWIYKPSLFLEPQEDRCLIFLSDGGTDATAVREFDLSTDRFVPHGFRLPPSKAGLAWRDRNTLYLAPARPATSSGYPLEVRLWHRGSPPGPPFFQGKPSDVGVWPQVFYDHGHRYDLICRYLSFDRCRLYRVGPGDRVAPLDTPVDAKFFTVFRGRLVLMLRTAWKGFPAGSLVAVPMSSGPVEPVLVPGPLQAVSDVASCKSYLLVQVLDDVWPHLYQFRLTPRGWLAQRVPTAPRLAARIVDTSAQSDHCYIATSSFLVPTSILSFDGATGELTRLHSLPPQFDATGMRVEQLHCSSRDGTRIPYFVILPRAAKAPVPTLMTAYGGFGLSLTPHYLRTFGRVWLQRGGAYVVANIRGGGEFGPAWHQAAMGTGREKAFQDLFAVARDLVRRGITTSSQLGFEGGSNGGLLGGVAYTQHPELFGAVVLQVPILDMLRYDKLEAGASWKQEYGDLRNPKVLAFWRRYSPYANVRAGVHYPPLLITASTADDRVDPAHARKMVARLKRLGQPALYYETSQGGHEGGPTGPQPGYTTALEDTFLIEHLMGPNGGRRTAPGP